MLNEHLVMANKTPFALKTTRFMLEICIDYCFSVGLVSGVILTRCMQMDALKINRYGRSYHAGKRLSNDVRTMIIDKIIGVGGDRTTGYIPVNYAQLSRDLRLSLNTVKNIWRRFCEEYELSAKPAGGFRWSKFDDNDLQLIEVLKHEKPSITFAEIVRIVEENGGVQNISITAVARAIKQGRLPCGLKYSRKKMTKLAIERLTPENMIYTQLFIDYLNAKDPRKLKFFDEAGIKLPDVGGRAYGHSPVGVRCVEVVRKSESPNTTPNLLVSLNGPEYYNIVSGPTNTVHFLEFFEEAAEATNLTTARPCLEMGDTIVMDNLSCHHYEGGEVLEDWLHQMGIELIFTPAYSPDLNPVEFCFNKLKGLLNGELQNLVALNTNLATMEAVEKISAQDMRGFYQSTSYLFA